MLHFGKIPKKFGENLARFSKKVSKILAKFATIEFVKKISNNFSKCEMLTKILRLENGAEECIV